MQPMKPMEPMKAMQPMGFGPAWWPAELGRPSSSGGQDGIRYAFFSVPHRLLIEDGGMLTTYDTGDHQISGVSQAQSSGRSLSFTSQDGEVSLGALKKV